MVVHRYLYDILNKIRKSILLLGPRQTGKSSLIQLLKPDLIVNLADEQTFVEHLSDPSLLKHRIGSHKTIFVDEIQRIPSLLNTIQFLMDSNKELQFFLSGSSARKLRRGQANLLPGRVLGFELGPLAMLELGRNFNLKKALARGLLPGIFCEEEELIAHKTLQTYAITYLREEIQAEALTKNLEGFSRFYSVVISRSGDYLDFSKISKEASIKRMSARRYYDILLDTLIAHEIPPFTRSKKRRLIQHPKFFFFDVGVLNGSLGNFETSPDRIGMLFEHLVQQLIFSGASAKDEQVRISSYRTESGSEVDFIVEQKSQVFAIEVKASKNVTHSDLKGLKGFKDFYGKKINPMIIYLGENILKIDDIDIFPLEDAMKTLGY